MLAELASLLDESSAHSPTAADSILGRPSCFDLVEIVHVDVSLDVVAWQLWQSRPDKEWSFVDCAALRRHATAQVSPKALTTDHHFEQAGFVRLLK